MNLLVSCPGKHNGSGQGSGGLVCIHESQSRLVEGLVRVVDRRDSTGLCAGRGMVFRLARTERVLEGYDEYGQLRYSLRLPELENGHDVRMYAGQRMTEFVIASTGENRIRRYSAVGQELVGWAAPGQGDAWHLNCMWIVGGQLYATAFGAFRQDRAWKGRDEMSGFLMEISSKTRLLDGLSEPHSPRLIDGRWVLCESMTKSLAVQDEDGRLRRVVLNGYTRGLDWDERYLYVGESQPRDQDTALGSIAVLDRASLEVVNRVFIPFPEVYEVLVVSRDFAAGVCDGAE